MDVKGPGSGFRFAAGGKFFAIILVLLLSGEAGGAFAQNFQSGRAALERGDAQRARQIWKPLAAAGDADALNGLGWLYDTGKGVAEDNGRALALYLEATKGGNAAAPTNLAQMYASGDGVPQDLISAYMWMRIAGLNGYADVASGLEQVAGVLGIGDIEKGELRAKLCVKSGFRLCHMAPGKPSDPAPVPRR